MFSHVSVHPSIHPSVCPHIRGGGTPARGAPAWGTPWVPPSSCQIKPVGGGTPARGRPPGVPPSQVRMEGKPARGRLPGVPPRTAHGVLDKRRSVCLLRSRRRTFLFYTIPLEVRGVNFTVKISHCYAYLKIQPMKLIINCGRTILH